VIEKSNVIWKHLILTHHGFFFGEPAFFPQQKYVSRLLRRMFLLMPKCRAGLFLIPMHLSPLITVADWDGSDSEGKIAPLCPLCATHLGGYHVTNINDIWAQRQTPPVILADVVCNTCQVFPCLV